VTRLGHINAYPKLVIGVSCEKNDCRNENRLMMLMMLMTGPCFALVEILAYYMQARTWSRGARSHYSWPALIIEALLPPGDSRVTWPTSCGSKCRNLGDEFETPNLQRGEHLNPYAIRSSSKNKQRQKRLGRFRMPLQ
jgi:hypothetical protein